MGEIDELTLRKVKLLNGADSAVAGDDFNAGDDLRQELGQKIVGIEDRSFPQPSRRDGGHHLLSDAPRNHLVLQS